MMAEGREGKGRDDDDVVVCVEEGKVGYVC